MIHPSVPAVMVTPICPHSLSFRPIVVPAGIDLKITVSPDSRFLILTVFSYVKDIARDAGGAAALPWHVTSPSERGGKDSKLTKKRVKYEKNNDEKLKKMI